MADQLLPTTGWAATHSRTGWSIAAAPDHGAARARARTVACRRDYLAQAQDDATLLAIRDMERAGIDIITDGEMRRESYPTASPRRSTASTTTPRDHHQPRRPLGPVPRVVGRIAAGPGRGRRHEIPAPNTKRKTKMTLPGPVHHGAAGGERVLQGQGRDRARLRRRGERGGARPQSGRRRRHSDGRPWLRSDPGRAERIGVKALNRALQGIPGPTVVHLLRLRRRGVGDKPTGIHSCRS